MTLAAFALALLAIPVFLVIAVIQLVRRRDSKKWFVGSGIASVVMFLAVIVGAFGPKDAVKVAEKAKPPAPSQPAPVDPVPVLSESRQGEFLGAMDAFHRQYTEAPNEIRKSAVFREARSFERSFFAASRGQLAGWKATLTSISTDKGGERLRLAANLKGELVTIRLSQSGISAKSPVYAVASNFAEGQCVLIVGTINPVEQSISELGAMVRPEYNFGFSTLAPCQSEAPSSVEVTREQEIQCNLLATIGSMAVETDLRFEAMKEICIRCMVEGNAAQARGRNWKATFDSCVDRYVD